MKLNANKLNSSAVVEIYRRDLDEMAKQDLSRKDKKKLGDAKRLLEKVSEINVDEPKMLYRVFKANYTDEQTL